MDSAGTPTRSTAIPSAARGTAGVQRPYSAPGSAAASASAPTRRGSPIGAPPPAPPPPRENSFPPSAPASSQPDHTSRSGVSNTCRASSISRVASTAPGRQSARSRSPNVERRSGRSTPVMLRRSSSSPATDSWFLGSATPDTLSDTNMGSMNCSFTPHFSMWERNRRSTSRSSSRQSAMFPRSTSANSIGSEMGQPVCERNMGACAASSALFSRSPTTK
jgi:hypothetical protein